jgi:hypothetical protein
MQRIGSAGLMAAIGQLEASREARATKAPASPQGAPGRPSEAGAMVRSLERERAVRKAAKAAQLEALLREAGESPEAAAQSADRLRVQTPNGWTFIMISPAQNAAVVRWLMDNSMRPMVAMKLWVRLFEVIRNDTGEVMASRADLAAHVGVDPDNLTRIMSELVSINAIRRERHGRRVTFFMNSAVATHLPATARRAARESDGPLLVVMDGGRSD